MRNKLPVDKPTVLNCAKPVLGEDLSSPTNRQYSILAVIHVMRQLK